MFNLQGSELFIILLLALVVLGPEKLPEAMRKLGEFVAQMKKMSAGFQQEFKAAVDEPMREVRDTATLLRDSVDFRKLQDGERSEKPQSGDMAAATPIVPDPVTEPTPPFVPTSYRNVETPVDPPIEVPVDIPVDIPVAPPVEVPAELPVDEPAFQPRFDAPVDDLAGTAQPGGTPPTDEVPPA